jgi:hypothetical protein
LKSATGSSATSALIELLDALRLRTLAHPSADDMVECPDVRQPVAIGLEARI